MSPYIPSDDRAKLDAFLEGLSRNIDSKGELTYALTMLALAHIDKQGKSYDTYSDVLGCLTATTHEVYRTEVAKYEDAKRIANGPLKRSPSEVGKRVVEEHSEALGILKGHAIGARRCPCGGGVDRCEGGECIGSEGTTTGGW